MKGLLESAVKRRQMDEPLRAVPAAEQATDGIWERALRIGLKELSPQQLGALRASGRPGRSSSNGFEVVSLRTTD